MRVRRLKPVTTGRGGNSTRVFEVDSSLPVFYVPGHLVRVGKIALKHLPAPLPRGPNRSGRQVLAPAAGRYELSTRDKARVYELCRIFDDTSSPLAQLAFS